MWKQFENKLLKLNRIWNEIEIYIFLIKTHRMDYNATLIYIYIYIYIYILIAKTERKSN